MSHIFRRIRAGQVWMERLVALVAKEGKQLVREPSSWLVGFVLPAIFLLFFGFAMSLDADNLRLAVLNESAGKGAHDLELAFRQSPHFLVRSAQSRQDISSWMADSTVQGALIIPQNFDALLMRGLDAPVQLLVDGVEPNTATFFFAYAQGISLLWQAQYTGQPVAGIRAEPLFWYNDTAKSRWALIPGSITIVMTLIGTLLTSLVITREWERGTMEALFASPITRMHILLGKLIPYYLLAMISMSLCTLASVFLFEVPFRGSIGALFFLSSAFLIPALGQGLLVSSIFRSQLPAAIVGFLSGLLPALILSGLMFDIESMPQGIQFITLFIPARYFNVALQNLFLAGDVWALFWRSAAYMVLLGTFFLVLTYRNLVKKLD